MVESVLTRAGLSVGGLDAVAVGCGPGSLTGVRIGTGVAQGLAFAGGVPIVCLSSLAMAAAALADDAPGAPGVLLVAQDARMGEVYWAAFDRHAAVPEGLIAPLVADRLNPPGRVLEQLRAVTDAPLALAAGSAVPALLPETHAGHVIECALPDAVRSLPLALAVLQRSGGLPPERAVPVYFRPAV
jgi:tRNA threonylcarbamoyladenosine biosynthesis protein TsaB